MVAQIIEGAFSEMVLGMSKTVTPSAMPHLYHDFARTHEINSVYHFAGAVERHCNPCAVYLEYQCDSGRIDAVIVTASAWLLVEAKSCLDFGRLGSLEDQAARLENSEDSLRRYLESKIPAFKREMWGLRWPTNPRTWSTK
jgi:hypothetical protein